MKGRVRLMTAHPRVSGNVSRATIPWRPAPFRLPKPKSRYPYLPNDRSITRERGNMGGLFIQMVVLALLMVKLLLDGV